MRPTSRELNGSRPARLKINKESHSIQKSSSSSTSSSSTATSSVDDHHRDPVIIYTHSPKVIHTEARDFMALVQKLTGLTPTPFATNDDNAAAKCNMMPPPPLPLQLNMISFDDSYNPGVDLQVASSSISSNSPSSTDSLSPPQTVTTISTTVAPDHVGLSEIPVLKPDSVDFFFPGSPCFLYQEMSEISPSMVNGWIQPAFGYGDHENLF